nr:hypothetical protein [Kibdelosporangium sp. MJ126-NF4]CTQ90593.1 hypothetical protein [Kibdelosporangium sp. MJ126-NF4]
MSTANRVDRPRVGFPLGGLPSGEDLQFGPRANSSVGNEPDTAGSTGSSLRRRDHRRISLSTTRW